MKIVFNGTPLADHTANPPVNAIIEQWGGQSVVQTEKRYGQSTEVDFPRGNVGGNLVFTTWCSYNDYNSPLIAFATAYALLNAQGTLIVTPTPGDATVTMLHAVCRDVQKVVLNGHGLELRYTFKITTVTTP